jgi:hypothetical protein
MQLRNQKDTVELTVEEIKGEVYPDRLDMSYSWPAQVGERVWIKVDMKWRRGVVLKDEGHAWTDRGLGRHFLVGWGGRKKIQYQDIFCPWSGTMKPDNPSIMRCLAAEGYDVLTA